ncbi:hypothetical protein BVX95_02160 [archaeon D22]|nr:hypothetical protein BVX95_02160 [archaeon D22]
MTSFIIEFWNEFDVNLRKGYVTFFILAMTMMPFAKYISEIYQTCQEVLCTHADLAFYKNLLVLFILYIFLMIVVILGFVMKFLMIGYTKPTIKEKITEESKVEEDKKSEIIEKYEENIKRLW